MSTGRQREPCTEVVEIMRTSRTSTGGAAAALLALAAAWIIGFGLASIYMLPVFDYTRTSERLSLRSTGDEERPPVGLKALPQVVMPTVYGSSQAGSIGLTEEVEQESTATAIAVPIVTSERFSCAVSLIANVK